MIAANISTQPESSRTESACPNITQPAINEITDSRLRIKDATVGFMPRCPTIWSVYATPQEKTPAYSTGTHACRTAHISGFSNSHMQTADSSAHTKNWMHDIFTPSASGAK